MGSRTGFEYHYSFERDDDIILEYDTDNATIRKFSSLNLEKKTLFEIRTNFVAKAIYVYDGPYDLIIGSESFAIATIGSDFKLNMDFWMSDDDEIRALSDASDDESYLKVAMGRRLKDYWMSDDEIQEFVRKSLAFANLFLPNPKYGTIGVVVNLNVCTVQTEDDGSIAAITDRAIKRENLYPINLCPLYRELPRKNGAPNLKIVKLNILHFLRHKLDTIRVEDADKWSLCPICLRNPTVGAQVSLLGCGHAFHTYCIVGWLERRNSCPMCRRQADGIESGSCSFYLDELLS